MDKILGDAAATEQLGIRLAALVAAGDVIALSGPLGAGKTSVARGLLAALGLAGEAPSPSFAIVQPYDDLAPPLWHADLYRIAHPSELAELGLDSVLGEGVLVVEWPDNAGEGAWPPSALALSLAVHDDGTRSLTAKPGLGWESRWPPR